MENLKNIEIKIPNLGEANETEIIEVNISVGDKINLDDPLIVLESEKAAMEVPSEHTGEISEVLVKEGDSVSEGMVFAKVLSAEVTDKTSPELEKNPIDDRKQQENDANVQATKSIKSNESHINFSNFNAGPAVRKYARELDLDLSKISGSGKNNRITKDDLKNFIHNKASSIDFFKSYENDFSNIGKYRINKLSKIRQIGAKNLHKSWISIPHVTHFEEISMDYFEKNIKNESTSLLSYLVSASTHALKKFEIFNSSLIEENKILIKENINIGIAVDTEDGLLVPVIKEADKLTIEEINAEIKSLANRAREKKLLKKHLEGATFSISSLGKVGGVGFTPIINPPEVAIISVSRTKKVAKLMDDGKLVNENILPIAMSYDHRVINGADAGKFLFYIKEFLEGKLDESSSK